MQTLCSLVLMDRMSGLQLLCAHGKRISSLLSKRPGGDPSGFGSDPFTDVLRDGARKLIEQAIHAELANLMAAFSKDMLEDMMGSENPGKVGIQVDFLDSPLVSVAPEDLDASRIISFSAKRGVNCRRTSSVKNLTAMIWPAGDLTTEANASKAMLVRVEGCYRPDERPSMVDLLFPKEYYSNFVVLRKK